MRSARLAFESARVIWSVSKKSTIRATAVRYRASVSVRPSRTTPTVTKGTNSHDTNADNLRRRSCRRAWSNSSHRFFVSSQRGRGNDQDGELAAGQHHHLSRAGEVEGSPPAHYRYNAFQQSDQRRSRYHRSDGGPRPQWHSS